MRTLSLFLAWSAAIPASVVLICLVLSPRTVHAQTIPAASGDTYCGGGWSGNLFCTFASDSAGASLAGASVNAASADSYIAQAEATYFFEVNYSGSGTASHFVPIFVTSSGSATASGSGNAGASFSIGGNLQASASANQGYPALPTSFSGVKTFYAGTGQYQVDLYASADGTDGYSGSAPGAASAFVDPYFEIDPTFASQNPGYSLAFSDGIVNAPSVSPVPEPTTPILLASGLAVLAFSRRKKA